MKHCATLMALLHMYQMALGLYVFAHIGPFSQKNG